MDSEADVQNTPLPSQLISLVNEGVFFIPAPSINNPVQVNYWQGHAGS